jgi:tRNA nucleotidyltransferase (CCA-adding enzyme)
VLACEADSRGRKHFEETTYHSGRRFLELASIAIQIDTSTANHTGLKGKQIGDAIRQLRIKAVNAQMHSATTQL